MDYNNNNNIQSFIHNDLNDYECNNGIIVDIAFCSIIKSVYYDAIEYLYYWKYYVFHNNDDQTGIQEETVEIINYIILIFIQN